MINFKDSEYNVTITMDDETTNDLIKNNYHLYAFRAAQGNGTGSPVVWQSQDVTYKTLKVNWQASYGAFICSPPPLDNINGETEVEIDLGQKFVINEDGTYGVQDGGPADTILISNKQGANHCCGISECLGPDDFNPLCSFYLPKYMAATITPIQQVVLIFSTKIIKTATVVERAMSAGISIDLTSNPNRTVFFKGNKWSSKDPNGINYFDADDSLNPYLINPAKSVWADSTASSDDESNLVSRIVSLEKRLENVRAPQK